MPRSEATKDFDFNDFICFHWRQRNERRAPLKFTGVDDK